VPLRPGSSGSHTADSFGARLRSINRATGAVTREALYDGQSMDHPKVNPLFAGRRTRFAYFNGSFHVADQPNVAGPPQVWCPVRLRVGVSGGGAALWAYGLGHLGRGVRNSLHLAAQPNVAGPAQVRCPVCYRVRASGAQSPRAASMWLISRMWRGRPRCGAL